MQILDCLRDLSNDMSTEILAEVGQSHNLMEKLAAWAKLKDDVVILP
jgi:hypothetical protein